VLAAHIDRALCRNFGRRSLFGSFVGSFVCGLISGLVVIGADEGRREEKRGRE
jgi:hypothetical protein